jgi:hypothetical protein
MPRPFAGATIRLEVRTMRRLDVVGLFLVAFLLLLSAQAAAAKRQPSTVKKTAKPILTLALDGPRVAYMRSDRRVGVWNVATGSTSTIKGTYPSNGRHFGFGRGEIAIAGNRVAFITRFVTGNSQQTQERLYTAVVGGSARQLGKPAGHVTDPLLCEVYDPGFSYGDWIAGVVGSGQILAVSSWTSDKTVSSDERLSLITSTGLRTIATGPDAIVAASASAGHIAVVRSTLAWPAGEVGPETATPTVGIYSADGALLGEVALSIPTPGCFTPWPAVKVALSGNELVVLTTIPNADPDVGGFTATFDVYDWTTGTLLHTWAPQGSGAGQTFAASGRLAVYPVGRYAGGIHRLRLLDLTTGKDVVIASSRGFGGGLIPVLGPRGLVYADNSYLKGHKPHGKLVFVPRAKLLAAVSG